MTLSSPTGQVLFFIIKKEAEKCPEKEKENYEKNINVLRR